MVAAAQEPEETARPTWARSDLEAGLEAAGFEAYGFAWLHSSGVGVELGSGDTLGPSEVCVACVNLQGNYNWLIWNLLINSFSRLAQL